MSAIASLSRRSVGARRRGRVVRGRDGADERSAGLAGARVPRDDLHEVSQRGSRERDGSLFGLLPRPARRRRRRGASRRMGKSRSQAPYRHDAAGQRAASRRARAASVHRLSRRRARRARGAQPQSGPAGIASAEPHRVRERDSRSTRARRRRQGALARRRCQLRFRQRRGLARRLAGARRAICECGGTHRAARSRRRRR